MSFVNVATVALNAAKNAGILAAQIIGSSDDSIAQKLADFKEDMIEKVNLMSQEIKK